ncbi:MAG: SdpI family protein [Acidobacteriota bacterium]
MATFAAALATFPSAPDQVPIHWTRGVADGFAPKAVGLFLIPALAVILYGLAHLPSNGHEPIWAAIRLSTAAFHAALASVILAAAWGYPAPTYIVGVLVGGVLLTAGWLAPQVSQGWVVGVRTPWTLRSDAVWRRTHAMARPVFLLGGLIVIGAAIAAPAAVGRIIGAVLLTSAAVLTAASYAHSVQERRKHRT